MIEYLTRYMGPDGIVVLPPIILLVFLCSAVVWWIFSGHGRSRAIKKGLISSALIGLGFVFWSLYDINTSKSSTAAIDYIFLPFATLFVCVTGYLLSWLIAQIIIFCMRHTPDSEIQRALNEKGKVKE
jgi:hypothetical protein